MKKHTIITLSFLCMLFTRSFAQGFYMEMKMSTEKGEMGTMKVYSQDGNSRSEMAMTGGPMAVNMATLMLKSDPAKIYMLNETNKTYSEYDVNSKDEYKDADVADYDITVIGKEKVNGYNCTHVKVKRKGSTHDMDWWTTKEMTDYADFSKVKSQYTGKSNLFAALAAKGADGFPVRIKTEDHNMTMQIDLVKAEKRNNPSSLFSLSGYTKSSTPTMPGSGVDYQKIQQMTPEEREKWIEQMKSQYGQPH